MSDTELIKTVGELIESVAIDEGLQAVTDVATSAGGFVLGQAGRLAVGGLLKRGYRRLCEELRKRQAAGKIAEDFERTDHGAKLLQEALNALAEGLDENQAKAVQDVFLGLAQTPPKDAMDRVQQLSILEAAAALTPWEIATLNLLERISKKHFDRECEEHYLGFCADKDRMTYMHRIGQEGDMFHKTLLRHVDREEDYEEAILDALDSLAEKKIVREMGSGSRMSDSSLGVFMCCRHHVLSKFGSKLISHLYTTAEPG